MTTILTRTIEISGDTLAVHYTDSGVWVSPCDGPQHSTARNAMRAELEHYFSSCGEDLDDESIKDEIEELARQVA